MHTLLGFYAPTCKPKISSQGKPLCFLRDCKSLCLTTNCLYHTCPVIKMGYYLLEQVAVLQKDHAGMGHLCRREKQFVLSTIWQDKFVKILFTQQKNLQGPR